MIIRIDREILFLCIKYVSRYFLSRYMLISTHNKNNLSLLLYIYLHFITMFPHFSDKSTFIEQCIDILKYILSFSLLLLRYLWVYVLLAFLRFYLRKSMLLHFTESDKGSTVSFNFVIQIALPLNIVDSDVHSPPFLGAFQSNDRGIQNSVYLYANEKIKWKGRKREKTGSTLDFHRRTIKSRRWISIFVSFFLRALNFLSLSLVSIFTRLPVSFLAVPSFLLAWEWMLLQEGEHVFARDTSAEDIFVCVSTRYAYVRV